MACAEYEELILDYFDGALSLEQHQSVEAHLAGCSGCREFWEAQQDLDAALAARFSPVALSAGFEQQVLERLDPEWESRRFWRLSQVLDLAGYLALTAAGGYVVFYLASLPAVEAAFPQFATYASWAAGALCCLYLLWAGIKPEPSLTQDSSEQFP
jgi:anti-sigma factor RsiW